MQNQLNKLYRQTQMDSAPSGRQIEISILEMASSKLRSNVSGGEKVNWSRSLDDALKFNQKVWDVFSADWMSDENPLPTELRQDLLSIAVFVKKKTFSVMANPTGEAIQLLIQLNDNILNGLKAGRQGAETEAVAPAH